MKKFTFEFTEEQINYIVNVIANTRSYAEAKPLLDLINQQAASQMQEEPEVELEKV
jgi:hypothetical protein